MLKRLLKYTLFSVLALILILAIYIGALYQSADMKEPTYEFNDSIKAYVTDSLRTYKNNWLRLNSKGVWEMKIEGTDFERGEAIGKLSPDLLYFQESVFINQIREIIPSDSYLKFLRFFIILFNRNLGENIPEEYRNEIYGISQSCTHEFDAIGNPYERQLNYHAAHDLGHAMQDYMMVGCTSFATWGDASVDNQLTIGRNFDFYVGDDFAKNKLITFCKPDKGYNFVSIGWVGMIGVLSGMNEEGLTVTINAAKSDVPTSSATPISILAREILQYASNIDEAYEIAKRRETFVSESLLIGSKNDNRAVIIEKSPEKIAMFQSNNEQIVCTNHFQSELFESDKRNIENIASSDSPYRYARVEELLNEKKPIDPIKAVDILRERKGLEGTELGLTNELAINQLIAHHGVVMQPQLQKIWISTAPWQCGEFLSYDLNRVFNDSLDIKQELFNPNENVPEDNFLSSDEYQQLLMYKQLLVSLKHHLLTGTEMSNDSIDLFIKSNPNYYHVYDLIGDYYKTKDIDLAEEYWKLALTKPIPHTSEKNKILHKLN